MTTILGDAKIKVSLDVENARRQLLALEQKGTVVRDRRDWEQELKDRHENVEKGIQTTRSAPLRYSFKAAKALIQGHPAQAGSEILNLAGKAAGLAIRGYILKVVVDEIEAGPKRLALMKGFSGELANNPLIKQISQVNDYLSDQVTALKAKIAAFEDAGTQMKDVGRASLRLGQNITARGSMDLFSFLKDQAEREEKMRLRVDKVIDVEILERLGESARQSFNR